MSQRSVPSATNDEVASAAAPSSASASATGSHGGSVTTRSRAASKKRAALGDISNKAPTSKKGTKAAAAATAVDTPVPAGAGASSDASTTGAVVAAGSDVPVSPPVTDIDVEEPSARPYIDYISDHFLYLRSMEVRGLANVCPPRFGHFRP